MFHSFQTMVLSGKDPAWYTVTSEDSQIWHATLFRFNGYQRASPPSLVELKKENRRWIADIKGWKDEVQELGEMIDQYLLSLPTKI